MPSAPVRSPTSQAPQQCQAGLEEEAEAAKEVAKESDAQSHFQEEGVRAAAGARAEAAARVAARADALVQLPPELVRAKAEARAEARAEEAVAVKAGNHLEARARNHASFMQKETATKAGRASSGTIKPTNPACCTPKASAPMEISADIAMIRRQRQLHPAPH